MADRIQQEAISGSQQLYERHSGEELDQAAPNHQKKIPDYENYDTKKEDLLGPAKPKASACPPQFEQTATKRQASQEIRQQTPPSQFLNPEDQKPGDEQRPDAAKKAKPPSPPGELRTKEWLTFPGNLRLRLPESEDMNIIHISALFFKWQLL